MVIKQLPGSSAVTQGQDPSGYGPPLWATAAERYSWLQFLTRPDRAARHRLGTRTYLCWGNVCSGPSLLRTLVLEPWAAWDTAPTSTPKSRRIPSGA